MKGDELELPPGFRFHPTDEELVMYYLCRKCASQKIGVPVMADIDLYKFDPWQLPDMALYGEKEWYFFSPRDRKYPNGSRPNRAAGTGYWKATGADKPIGKPKAVGIKKALVFYAGKAPNGVKTNWIMHEYRLANVDRSAGKRNTNIRLDDWVLCRIYNKKGIIEKHLNGGEKMEKYTQQVDAMEEKKPLPHFEMVKNDSGFDSSDSGARLHTDSSRSEQELSPEFTYEMEKEVQSEPPNWDELENALSNSLDLPFDYMDDFIDDRFGPPQIQYTDQQPSPVQDIFMLFGKPF